MAQINGSDARIVVRPERTFKTLPVVLVDDCESAWSAGTGNTTVTADATVFKQGTKSAKMVEDVAGGAGDTMAYKNFAAKDLSYCTKVGFWIRSSIALAAGDLQLLLDDTNACASPLEAIDIPAITAGEVDTWVYRKCTISTPASCTAILSVGIKMVVDKAGFTVYIDDVRALEGDAYLIPFNTAEIGMQEDLEDSNAIRSGRQPQMPTGGNISGNGTITMELNPYHAVLLKHILGGYAFTDLGGGVGQHDISIGDLGNGLAIEVQHSKEKICTVYHCKGNTFKISQSATGKVMLDTGWEVASEEAATLVSTLDGDPLDYGHKPFSAKFGAFYEGGIEAAALATSLNIDYTNNVEGEPTIGSEGERDSLTEGGAKINFSLDMLYKDNTYVNKAKNLTESALKIININGAGDGTLNDEYCSLDLPEIRYARPKNKIDGPKGLKQSFSGIAYYDNDAGGEAIVITIKNTQAAALP